MSTYTYNFARAAALACLLLWPAASSAQTALSIDDVARILKAVHDAERPNLGAGSSRDERNEFFARVVGIVRYGHSRYNPTPDGRWCIKNGGNGRPQSDDVIVLCDTREAWDMMGGVGANGYNFSFHAVGVLPQPQEVYPPARPADAGGTPPAGGGTPTPTPTPTPAVNLQPVLDALARLEAKLDTLAGVTVEARDAAKSAEHDARELNAFRLTGGFDLAPLLAALEPFKAGFPEYSGRILGAGVTLRPKGR